MTGDDGILPWAQLVGVLVAVVAVVGTWMSALAARRSAAATEKTAQRADLTARRAARALSRATSPDPFAWLFAVENPWTADAVPWEVDVRNEREHRGLITAVRLSRSDGYTCSTTSTLPMVIGGIGVPYQPDARIRFPIGPIPPAIAEGVAWGDGGTPDRVPGRGVTIDVVVELADQDRVVTWRQVTRFQEIATACAEGTCGSMPREFRPRWQLDLIDRQAPVALTDDVG